MELDLFVSPGLGDTGYLLSSGDEAAVIDPQRDVRRVLEAAEARGARIRFVAETHVHNDYVSGAAELRAATGAEIAGPASAGYDFAFTPLEDGSELSVGDVTLTALATPGHTFEHTSYLARATGSAAPAALFSGGSLIVGSAGRTDLLGGDYTAELTHLQFASMRRLSELPDAVALLPTHGAGSFCAASPPGAERTSSLGAERLGNPALTAVDEALFVRQQLTGLARYPDYYAHMAPINRSGPIVLGDVPIPRARSADEVARSMSAGAWLVDARDGSSFAEGHVPGSLNVPAEESFASYVGWLVPFGQPLALIVPDEEALLETATQLFRIGYDRVEGHLEGGIAAWRASGRDVSSFLTIAIADLVEELERGEAADVVDVRQRTEWDEGHLERSRHVFVGDVPHRLDDFDRSITTTVVCASGYRSAMAASMLDRAGVPVRLVPRSGVPKALRLTASSRER
jgi:glyoxylase-like metal-dependent hydrolase (beta-lactamase superfamily II)/rhodanese-related sulfurtransferase